MQRSFRVPAASLTLGAVTTVIGVIVFLLQRDDVVVTGGIGYSSYASLDTQTSFGPGGVLWSGAAVAGLAVAVVGLLIVATTVGFVVGRRRGQAPATG